MRAVMRRPARRQAGLTIVELLVSMALLGLVIAMVFSLFIQSSMAYRTTAQISELQQVLVAANNMALKDVRQAGNRVTSGFRTVGNVDHAPVEVDNDDTGPDELRVYYADSSGTAVTAWADLASPVIGLADTDDFQVGDLILLSDPQEAPPNVDPAPPATFTACVGKVASMTSTTVTLATVGPWGQAGNGHCQAVRNEFVLGGATPDTLAFRFAARGYRIDSTRLEMGVLQRSLSAGFEDDWEDLGIGFTDLQVATRWFEDGDAIDEDGNGDPERDWYSGDDQTTLTQTGFTAASAKPIEVTVSFVMRTSKKVSGVPTAATPTLTETGNTDHNPIGDRAAVQLEGVADAARPEELRGEHIYRYSTSRVHLRNLEVR